VMRRPHPAQRTTVKPRSRVHGRAARGPQRGQSTRRGSRTPATKAA